MKCNKCGYINSDNTNFCINCGESLTPNNSNNQMNNNQKPNNSKKIIIGVLIGIGALILIFIIASIISSAAATNKYLDYSRKGAFESAATVLIEVATTDYIENGTKGSKCYYLNELNSKLSKPFTKSATGNDYSEKSYVKVYMENDAVKTEACIIDTKHNGFDFIEGNYVTRDEFKEGTAKDCNCIE